jgi:peptide/nickel transport system permease protein
MSRTAPPIHLRFLRSRAVRKFRRNRMAMAALVVILAYIGVGVACLFGAISKREVSGRIGPDSVPGWLESQPLEKRLRDTEFYRKLVEAALKRADPEAAVREIQLAERRVVDLPVPELKKLVKQQSELHDEIADLYDETNDLKAEIARAGKPDARPRERLEPAAIAEKQSKIAGLETEALGKLTELEAVALRLVPMPDGWRGSMYKFRTFLGTDRQGRSISIRAIYSIRIALQVGLVVGLIAVGFGTLLGGAAAFFGGWVDHAVNWLYTTFSSIPELVLLSLIAYVFLGVEFFDELIPVYAALSLTFWIGPCRVIRGEVMKIKELEYVQAATAIGFRRGYIMLRHVLPNTAHLMLINFSLLFIAAIKTEVILTFLGLGVKNGASWGIMIEQSRQEVINGFFWQIGAATALMFVLVLAFNIVSDALQDAFDPKHVG